MAVWFFIETLRLTQQNLFRNFSNEMVVLDYRAFEHWVEASEKAYLHDQETIYALE